MSLEVVPAVTTEEKAMPHLTHANAILEEFYRQAQEWMRTDEVDTAAREYRDRGRTTQPDERGSFPLDVPFELQELVRQAIDEATNAIDACSPPDPAQTRILRELSNLGGCDLQARVEAA